MTFFNVGLAFLLTLLAGTVLVLWVRAGEKLPLRKLAFGLAMAVLLLGTFSMMDSQKSATRPDPDWVARSGVVVANMPIPPRARVVETDTGYLVRVPENGAYPRRVRLNFFCEKGKSRDFCRLGQPTKTYHTGLTRIEAIQGYLVYTIGAGVIFLAVVVAARRAKRRLHLTKA